MPAIRDQILNPAKRGAHNMRREAIELPELYDGKLYVRAMTVAEREAWQHENATQQEKGGKVSQCRARALVICLVDENGAPIFAPDDAQAIDELPTAPIERAYDQVLKLAGLMREEPEKNSPTTSGSSSGSPAS